VIRLNKLVLIELERCRILIYIQYIVVNGLLRPLDRPLLVADRAYVNTFGNISLGLLEFTSYGEFLNMPLPESYSHLLVVPNGCTRDLVLCERSLVVDLVVCSPSSVVTHDSTIRKTVS
jgi:hypothetical protein